MEYNKWREMVATSKWAQRRWKNDLYNKLRWPWVANKTWCGLLKMRKGTSQLEHVLLLSKQESTTAISSTEKTKLLADKFFITIIVEYARRLSAQLEK